MDWYVSRLYYYTCYMSATVLMCYISCFIPFRAVPGCLGSLGDFKNRFSDPIEQGQKHSATKRVLATGRKTVKALVRKISRWFLRRTKALIKEQLPKKDDRVRLLNRTKTKLNQFNHILDISIFKQSV